MMLFQNFFKRYGSGLVRRGTQFLAAMLIALAMLGLEDGRAQVPSNVLTRVRMIHVGPVSGTAFTIELDGRQYLVTAKHVVTALMEPEATIQICKDNRECSPLKVRILKCADPIDVAVLVPSSQLTVTFPLEPTADGMLYGQDVFFLGFPFGMGTRREQQFQIPFIKKAILSARTQEGTGTKFFLDGHNNPGFSGGPIVFRDQNRPGFVFKVAAVVQGFQNEFGDVFVHEKVQQSQITDEDRTQGRIVAMPDGTYERLKPTGELVRLNSGIVVGWAINHAIDLIRQNPIGPLVSETFKEQ